MLRTSFGMQILMYNFGAVDEYGTWLRSVFQLSL